MIGFINMRPRIYRITSIADGPNGKSNLAVTPAPMGSVNEKRFPGDFSNSCAVLKDEKSNLGEKGKPHFNEADLLYADSTFFDVFSFSLKEGNQNAALQAPNSIVLTRNAAKKYFGNQNAIGKTLEVNSFSRNFTVQVTAIADDLPANSHMQFNGLISLQTLGDISNLWAFHMFQSYCWLTLQTNRNNCNINFPTSSRNISPIIRKQMGCRKYSCSLSPAFICIRK
jgi:putative ABC transport system permease protein